VRNIHIAKKSDGLHKVSCSCGFAQFFTLGVDTDRVGEKHARDCGPSIIKRTLDGCEIIEIQKMARPGRPAGGLNSSYNDMGLSG
jgi:hypothetical protein